MDKLEGQWFRGNVFKMSVDDLVKSKKYETGVKKPTALRTKKIQGVEHSQYYHKPIGKGEFWD